MPTTPQGLRFPAASDSPNGPLQIGNLAADVDPLIVPRAANITERNTKLPSPQRGQCCAVNGVLHVYDGSAWRWEKRGLTMGTTDNSGHLVIPHGLGASPTGVIVSSGAQATDLLERVLAVNCSNSDVNNFVVYAHRSDTSAALPNNLIRVVWNAFV